MANCKPDCMGRLMNSYVDNCVAKRVNTCITNAKKNCITTTMNSKGCTGY